VAAIPSLQPAAPCRLSEGRKFAGRVAWARRPRGIGPALDSWWAQVPPPASLRARTLRPMAASSLTKPCSALPTVGGAKSAAPGDTHGKIDYISSMPSTNPQTLRRPASLFITPAATALRDIAGAVFFFVGYRSPEGAHPLASISGRRQRLSGSSLGLV
jgi:hypothetical protein